MPGIETDILGVLLGLYVVMLMVVIPGRWIIGWLER